MLFSGKDLIINQKGDIIVEYKIVSHTDTQTVEDRVNYWLVEGWELYGEIIV